MQPLRSWLTRIVDVRRDEVHAALASGLSLLLLVLGHTMLETARDVLLLTRLPPRMLGIISVFTVGAVLVADLMLSWLVVKVGTRRAASTGIASLAVCIAVLSATHLTPARILTLYVLTSLASAALLPLVWTLVASGFTIAQGRRLLGVIGGAGVFGAVLGAWIAATLLQYLSARHLITIAASLFAAAAVAVRLIPGTGHTRRGVGVASSSAIAAMREEPFLSRIALLIVTSAVATFMLDYLFKSTVVRVIPRPEVAVFISRYYGVVNTIAIVVQVLSATIVRRAGVVNLALIPPIVLLGGAVTAVGLGGALLPVVMLKAMDGTLRTPIQRTATELLYLQTEPALRARAKPFIDGFLARAAQAAAGAAVFLVGAALAPTALAGVVLGLLGLWLGIALSTRRAYLMRVRRAVSTPSVDSGYSPIDLESAEALVESLADDDGRIVVAAMSALDRRGRQRLIPALILLRSEAAVLEAALGIFGGSLRSDWLSQGRRLLRDPRESTRMAAARALARRGELVATDLAHEESARVGAYAAVHLALSRNAPILDDPKIASLLRMAGPSRGDTRLGMLAAVGDAPRDKRLLGLLTVLAGEGAPSAPWTEALARAAMAQHAVELIPYLVERLSSHAGRYVVTSALVSLGTLALDYVWEVLADVERPRELRAQMPGVLARFGTPHAASRLLDCVETTPDGVIRYKAIRALGRLVAERPVRLDRVQVERIALENAVEHFRLLGLRAGLSNGSETPAPHVRAAAERLLTGLLDDKLRQSLERTFRLLKIAHPREDFQGAYVAGNSDDRRARANAAEFVDTLLWRRDQRRLRDLVLLTLDDLPESSRLARALPVLESEAPTSRREALELLQHDDDQIVAALAAVSVGRSSDVPRLFSSSSLRTGARSLAEAAHA